MPQSSLGNNYYLVIINYSIEQLATTIKLLDFLFPFSGKDAKNMIGDEFTKDCRNVEK